MKNKILLIVFLLLFAGLNGQDITTCLDSTVDFDGDTTEEIDYDQALVVADKMPEFPGGVDALKKYIEESIRYPKVYAEACIQGTVFVMFVVEKDGSIGDAIVTRGVDPPLDKEAVRVIKTLPRFKPGMQDGEPVPVWLTVPVVFRLRDRE